MAEQSTPTPPRPINVSITCGVCNREMVIGAPSAGEQVDVICLHCGVTLEVWLEDDEEDESPGVPET